MEIELPRAGRLVAWGNAYLAGFLDLRTVVAEVTRPTDATSPEPDAVDWRAWLSALATAGTGPELRLTLPTPGDPNGLTGPPELTEAAIAAGQAVLSENQALVPLENHFGPVGDRGTLVSWTRYDRSPGPPATTTIRDAAGDLSRTIASAAADLGGLDLLPWQGDVWAGLTNLRSPAGLLLPKSYPDRAQRLAQTAARVRSVVALARSEPAPGLTSSATLQRDAALRELDRQARAALIAACQALAEDRPTSLLR